jgi:uncharacterized protein (TIGR03437 family)
MIRVLLSALFVFVFSSWGQLVPNGTPLPRADKPPVVFLNGYDSNCNDSSFASVFGVADQVLQADGRASVYFNNCDFAGKPPIEQLAQEFRTFLTGLRYTDGQTVDRVDVVAYSMGGLVVRSYLSGKQIGTATFNPPASTPIRKLISIATPHFGTAIALGVGVDRQVEQLTAGSQFLFDLATWNQGTDDLRGVDALAIVGSGGTGSGVAFPTVRGFDDGVVTLTSGSIGFVRADRTRVIPFCHTPGGGLISLFGLCAFDARSVVAVRSANEPQARLLLSFLNGTNEWMSIGTGVSDDPQLSTNGGVYAAVRDAGDAAASISGVTAQVAGQTRSLVVEKGAIAFADRLPAGAATVNVTGASSQSRSVTVSAGVYQAVTLKPGPRIARVYPSATAVFPLSVAPGMFVSVYGESLAAGAAQTESVNFPLQLSDAQVLVNGTAVPLHYAGPGQINAVIPDTAAGLVALGVRNGSGSHTVNVLVEPAVPSIFTQSGTGSGPASALSSANHLLVTETNPLRAGDYLQLYLTGLGMTTNRDGLDWANLAPTVTVAGQPCVVSYAGRAPGFRGLDQINCQIPAGLGRNASAPVVVTSGSKVSNTATVAVD